MKGLVFTERFRTVAPAWCGLRRCILNALTCLNGSRFACRVEQLGNDAPAGKDQFFQVQMIGLIPTPCDNYQTDVRVEITDITESLQHAEPVLSTDPQFQSGNNAIFRWQTSNGVVPTRNAVLVRWITVAQIPCHLLKFACRGRRRLQFKVAVLSAQSGRVLARAHKRIDYVNCSEGFRERQERKLAILHSSLLLSALAGLHEGQIPAAAGELVSKWIDLKGQAFPPALQLKDKIVLLEQEAAGCSLDRAAEGLLAWGERTDKEAAVELAVQAASCNRYVTAACFSLLTNAAVMLGVRHEHLLTLAQQHFLGAGCSVENPCDLLGIDEGMPKEQIIKRLNDEYRRWNARVTNPDAAIRLQTDRMLSLIAELRSKQFSTAAL